MWSDSLGCYFAFLLSLFVAAGLLVGFLLGWLAF